MSDYRLYVFDRLGRIVDAFDLESETDSRAITASSGYLCGRPMELWSRQDRFIKSFDGVHAGGAATGASQSASP